MNKSVLTICIIAFIVIALDLGESTLIELDPELIPAPIQAWRTKQDVKGLIKRLATRNEDKLPDWSDRKPVGTKTPVVGSNLTVYRDHNYDKGFFSTIYQAYKNHWVLVTTPEDWWFTLVRKVALDIDNNADKKEIRDFFVNHDGKKELVVDMGSSVYSANYSGFFDQMAGKIAESIEKPEYVNAMSSDFGTSTKTHKIVANIALMSSVQDYFSYTGNILCGIPKVDMQGSENDWLKLKTKIENLKEYLQPISNIMGQAKWWPLAESVAQKLIDTYQGNPDKAWWQKIVTKPGSVGCGGPVTFDGWFVNDFLYEQPDNLPSGLISVPMKIKEGYDVEQSALVAGIPGYMIEEGFNGSNDTTIQAVHAWTLMLEPVSRFRNDLDKLEQNNEIY